MTELPLTVVIASVNGFPYLGRCLDSLCAGPRPPAIIVADWTDEATRSRVRAGWPEVRLLSFDETMAVPELRAAGIAAADTPYVAVIEDHCVVRPQWAERLVAAHEAGHPVVGGPIRNGATTRLRDWAAFFCEYSEHMETFIPTSDVVDPSGTGSMNSLYSQKNAAQSRRRVTAPFRIGPPTTAWPRSCAATSRSAQCLRTTQ